MLTSIDILSDEVKLFHNSSTRHSNRIGGFLTILILMCSFAVSCYFFLEIIEKTNPKAYNLMKFVEDAGMVKAGGKGGAVHTITFKGLVNETLYPADKRSVKVYGLMYSRKDNQFNVIWNYDVCDYDKDLSNM